MQHDNTTGLIPLRDFCEQVGVTVNTVTMDWQRTGQAPDLIRISNRLYLTEAEWDDWFRRRDIARKRLGKPHLRAPEAPTPKPRNR